MLRHRVCISRTGEEESHRAECCDTSPCMSCHFFSQSHFFCCLSSSVAHRRCVQTDILSYVSGLVLFSENSTCCNESTDVGHVGKKPGVVLVSNLAHAGVVIVASVG